MTVVSRSWCAGAIAAVAAVALVKFPAPKPAAAAEPENRLLPSPDSAIVAVIEANDGKLPATGDQLWKALCRVGTFAQLPVAFSAARLDSGLAQPRVVIAPKYSGLSQADVTAPNVNGRLFLAANMERHGGKGDPKVRSVEFISWNTTRRQYDFGVIDNLGESGGEPEFRIIEGGKCFSCHKNRGPILGARPWSNTTHDDVLRHAVATGLTMTGSHLPAAGPYALPRPGGPGGNGLRDRIDGMALAAPEAQDVDYAVRVGAALRTKRDTFRLMSHTPEGRKTLVVLLAAIAEPGALEANSREVKYAVDTIFSRSFGRFGAEWKDLVKTTRSSILADPDPGAMLVASGVQPPNAKTSCGSRPGASVKPAPFMPDGAGSRWIAENWFVGKSYSAIGTNTPQRVMDAERDLDNFQGALIDLARYEVVRAGGRHGLTGQMQPSNPRAFERTPVPQIGRASDFANPVLLAETIGLTDGDRRFLARSLADAARHVGAARVTPAGLAKEVFDGPQFAPLVESGVVPDRDEFKDRFVAGLDDLLKTRHGRTDGFAPDRKGYASGPRYDPDAVEEKEAIVLPTSACLRCHDVAASGRGRRFDPIPPLAFDPFDKVDRAAWLSTADPKRKKEVVARLLSRLATSSDMPPEDSPEHGLFRVKNAAAFVEVKRFLAAELDHLKSQ